MAKKERMSDSDVELQEESYLRTLSEDFNITTDGNSNIEDKDNHRDSTAKSGVDGVVNMSLSGNVPTGTLKSRKISVIQRCHLQKAELVGLRLQAAVKIYGLQIFMLIQRKLQMQGMNKWRN